MEFIISLGIIGIMFIALGLPLMYRKVKQNMWYGARVSIYVYKDKEIWYDVNEKSGRHMVYIGVFLIFLALLSLLFWRDEASQPTLLIVGISAMFLSLAYSVPATMIMAHKMAKKKGLKKKKNE